MTFSKHWIFALSALVLVMQANCEEPKSQQRDALDKYGPVGGSFVPVPARRVRRDAATLKTDDCHKFHDVDLPQAKGKITAAWHTSMPAVQNITQAFSDITGCLTWNVFKLLPCAIHSTVELLTSFHTYKPELTQLAHDVSSAAGNATKTFVGCAKILIVHQR